MLVDAISRALRRKQENGWDKLYLAVDLHGVVLECSYNEDINIIEDAIEPLREFSNSNSIYLITYTSSWPSDVVKIVKKLDKLGIWFDDYNDNKFVVNNELSCFDGKFYFDLLLDDKAGFVPETDWQILYEGLKDIL